MTNHCAECQLCCRLLGVVKLAKMPGDPCRFCTPGKGCRIHDKPAMPQECSDYVCLWLQCRQEATPLPDELRPDRCHVVIDARGYETMPTGQIHNVRCDPRHPNAWREPAVQKLLAALVEHAGSTLKLINVIDQTEIPLSIVGYRRT